MYSAPSGPTARPPGRRFGPDPPLLGLNPSANVSYGPAALPLRIGLITSEGSAAYHQLSAWLADRPAPAMFESATRLIRAMLDGPAQDASAISPDDLVSYCETIAASSGGLLGINKISSEERALLASLAGELKKRHQ